MADYTEFSRRPRSSRAGWVFGGAIVLLVLLYLVLSTSMAPTGDGAGTEDLDVPPPVQSIETLPPAGQAASPPNQ